MNFLSLRWSKFFTIFATDFRTRESLVKNLLRIKYQFILPSAKFFKKTERQISVIDFNPDV